MKILHQLGHNYKWNLDAHFENKVGDGFIFSVFNFDSKVFGQKTLTSSEYNVKKDILPISSIDLQYYGKASSKDLGKFETYDFHPANYGGKDKTDIYGPGKISEGIKFQEQIDLEKIIIPNFYADYDIGGLLSTVENVSKKLKKKDTKEYYMTLPISFQTLKDEKKVEKILTVATDKNIQFNGYFIVAEPLIGYKHKICIDYDYLENLYNILKFLKKNGFKLILGYSNWDSVLFSALVEIDYITIGTYENLRNFKIARFTEEVSGGQSKGAYFSSKALNFIKAEEIPKFRRKNALDLIRNENNIFSDIILSDAFLWTSMHKPDIQKNYLLEINNFLRKIDTISSLEAKKKFLIKSLNNAIELYKTIRDKGIYLETESSDYHLEPWLTFLLDK